jgi:hypothetical protein
MAFVRNGHRILWTAADTTPSPPHLLVADGDLLNDLLSQFEAVFATPVGLPPARDHCHRIRLLPGTEPIAVRPYRYAHHQKAELERQCSDLLAHGVIRPSTSQRSRRRCSSLRRQTTRGSYASTTGPSTATPSRINLTIKS